MVHDQPSRRWESLGRVCNQASLIKKNQREPRAIVGTLVRSVGSAGLDEDHNGTVNNVGKVRSIEDEL